MGEGRPGLSRRRLFGVAGAAGAAGLTAGGLTGTAWGRAGDAEEPLSAVGATVVPFHGRHQAGITTPVQTCGRLAAFDLRPGSDRAAAAGLLRRWSEAAEAMAAGRPPAGDGQVALDAGPSSLTVTFGFGRTFFAKTGLGDRMPPALVEMPPFPADELDPSRSDGDLWVQIGADDPLVTAHALRVLVRTASGTARVRWQMGGFNRARGATDRPMTVRNLMGQIDGSGNPRPSEDGFEAKIFVEAGTGPHAWMDGGSYAVVRRIRMLLDTWDRLPRHQQERVIGRRKDTGAPLSGGTESARPDLSAAGPDGAALAIAGDAHVRVSAPESNGGTTMLRRSFSYDDGLRPDGTPDAGLLFIAWQADPTAGFIQVQRKLDGADGLTRFIRHESSAVFAVPGGAAPGDSIARSLLE
ncbi:iron uptake transporter deferrochelatase/peroxidase subunit [Actinomadura sp. 7K507]|uniref:iron uptake transporter deferrochelatase/peroxidase subunit n=1 Tax=Actinomadura sp. 7K507 TaxID=2530365 RepID=UPI00104E5CA4|nr:iron uptake transporter deferrochelatase/peroxidase subunit [Actinomadura sp. 7K507]TDC85247.1 deferrochelatase/peroxidase EfeB [Actinomadura sp. 7K507]